MAPVGRDIAERAEHKQTLREPRMRYFQRRFPDRLAVPIDDVDIEGARRVGGRRAHPAERIFYALADFQHGMGRQPARYSRNAVNKIRLLRSWYWLAFVPVRTGFDVDPRRSQKGYRRFTVPPGLAIGRSWQVRADCEVNQLTSLSTPEINVADITHNCALVMTLIRGDS